MKIIDSHAHPNSPQYDADRDEVIGRAIEAGVGMICVGVDLELSKKAIELAGKYETIWASVGLHPNDNLDEVYNQSVYENLAQHTKVVAIGEVGLDYYRTTEEVHKQTQRNRFEQQLDLAIKLEKPLIIHCRDAHSDLLAILKTRELKLPGGVIHSFTGTLAEAEKYLEFGFCLGFNGIITFANQYDEVVKSTPITRILLETDAPYLTPAPNRGKRNEPIDVFHIATRVGELKNIPDEDVMAVTMDTTQDLFQLY